MSPTITTDAGRRFPIGTLSGEFEVDGADVRGGNGVIVRVVPVKRTLKVSRMAMQGACSRRLVRVLVVIWVSAFSASRVAMAKSGDCESMDVSEVSSPDAQWVARVYGKICDDGQLSKDRYQVRFCPSDPTERDRWLAYKAAYHKWVTDMTAWSKTRSQDPSAAGPEPRAPTQPGGRAVDPSCQSR